MDFNYIEIGLSVLTIALGLLATKYGSRIKKIRKLVISIDEALKDGKLTKEEISDIMKQFKGLVS